jgi:hypothetical protein
VCRAAIVSTNNGEKIMSKLIPLLSLLLLTSAFANDKGTQSPTSPPKNSVHRYLVERTFPAGALKGLDAATKKKVNANNSLVGVRWVQSYANADETKTFCVYEGPSEAAVRKAAELNKLPVDSIIEVPVTLSPK